MGNDVTTNHAITVTMHISLGVDNILHLYIILGPDILWVVRDFKLLGVTVVNSLDWKSHVSTILKSSLYRLKLLVMPPVELRNVCTIFILLQYTSQACSSN